MLAPFAAPHQELSVAINNLVTKLGAAQVTGDMEGCPEPEKLETTALGQGVNAILWLASLMTLVL